MSYFKLFGYMGLSDIVPDLREVVLFPKGKKTHKNKNTCFFFPNSNNMGFGRPGLIIYYLSIGQSLSFFVLILGTLIVSSVHVCFINWHIIYKVPVILPGIKFDFNNGSNGVVIVPNRWMSGC